MCGACALALDASLKPKAPDEVEQLEFKCETCQSSVCTWLSASHVATAAGLKPLPFAYELSSFARSLPNIVRRKNLNDLAEQVDEPPVG
ncbi:Uncharacterised protein [Trueperella bialowiezensis]|uniref:Uncharacterized protein n=1 Tax=Trueperella bialowiezensis TaxID=312285 RepID=A0A3S4V5C2_9ACTO|nr:Uncharacterised protein [Trueperella bialowiezensis]